METTPLAETWTESTGIKLRSQCKMLSGQGHTERSPEGGGKNFLEGRRWPRLAQCSVIASKA